MNFGILQTPLVFILIFAILVFFHELGHFLLAKAFRMRVEEFALGMGNPKLRLFSDGQTEYTLRAIPIGGFVRIAGMEIEDAAERRITGASSKLVQELENTNIHALEAEAEEVANVDPDGFNSRPLHQRFLVIFAGPVFSFLLGWLALCSVGAIFGIPDQTRMVVKDAPAPTSIAYTAGIRQGDIFTGMNGKPVYHSDDVLDAIHDSAGKPLSLTVQSPNGPERTITVTPKAEKVEGADKPIGRIGIVPDIQILTVKRIGLGDSFARGTNLVGIWFQTMWRLVRSGAIKDNVGGPVAIFKETHDAAQSGATRTVLLLGQLSLSLGLFNLLPIPILDGGHLLLMAVECVRRRKLTAEWTGRVLTAGLAILAALFVLIMFKDVSGFFRRG